MSSKYPRTPHLPYSPGKALDDIAIADTDHFLNTRIIITLKCDGGNCALEAKDIFARSHNATPKHPSFDWIKSYHSGIKHLIPSHYSLFGENMFAKHAISYQQLPSYFLLFGARNNSTMMWDSWDQVVSFSKLIGLPTAPVLFDGQANSNHHLQALILAAINSPSHHTLLGGEIEGAVLRRAEGFDNEDFHLNTAKWVRAGHVLPNSEHWAHQKIVPNKLK